MGIQATGLFSGRNAYSEASAEFETRVFHTRYCPAAGRKVAVEVSGVLTEFKHWGASGGFQEHVSSLRYWQVLTFLSPSRS